MENRVALVTGAGTGIGKAAATKLVEAGWTTIFVGRSIERLEDAVRTADPLPSRSRSVAMGCDITKPHEVTTLFDRVQSQFGRLDLLFNNAGAGSPSTTIDRVPYEAWRAVLDVNVTGSFLCAQAAFRLMKEQNPRGGRIINNGSIAAHAPRPGSVGYTTTKHAITGLTKTLALDGRAFDIACGQIDIGNAFTEMVRSTAEGATQADGSVKPEAVMDVRHAADAVVFMASLPLAANVLSMNIMATNMPFVGRG